MAEALNLFPNRAAIGRVDTRGDVYMTTEFSRALTVLLARVGGPTGSSTDDLLTDLATQASATGLSVAQGLESVALEVGTATLPTAQAAELGKQVADLDLVTALAPQLGAQLAEARKLAVDLEQQLAPVVLLAAQLAEARKVAADLEQQLAPALQLLAQFAELRKTADALESLGSSVAAPVDWEHPGKIGASTPNAGRFAAFACNGATPRTSAALGAAASDLPTVITLANAMRAALINNGIGA